MATIKMAVQMRTEQGKNQVDKLRTENYIPAVIYSKGEEPITVKVESKEFQRIYKMVGTSAMISLQLDGKPHPVIIKDIQRHPYKNMVVHVDFQKLNMNEKVKMTVPVILHGRDNIRLQPSILMQVLDQVDIECLPADIPTNGGEVSVEDMTFDTPIMVKDLDIAQNPKIHILRDPDDVVCTLTPPSTYTEEEAEEKSAQDVEVIKEKKREEE